MPILTLTTHGTRQQFMSASDYTVNGMPMPTLKYAREIDIKLLTAGATVYIGKQRPRGVANAVDSTHYDIVLNDATPSIPIGYASEDNDVDLGDTWWDSDTDGAQIAIGPETT